MTASDAESRTGKIKVWHPVLVAFVLLARKFEKPDFLYHRKKVVILEPRNNATIPYKN